MLTLLFAIALAVPMSSSMPPASPARQVPAKQEYEKLSPFEAIRWSNDAPEVRVQGKWYAPRSIAGLEIEKILAFCRDTYRDRAVKRFEEDLVEVLTKLGTAPGNKVDLELIGLDDGKAIDLRDVAMTRENRQAIRNAAQERMKTQPSAPKNSYGRVDRAHAAKPAAEFADLARRSASSGGPSIERAAAFEDLDTLEWLIDTHYAYRSRGSFDYKSALDAVRLSVADRVDAAALALSLSKVLSRFGDGHTRIEELQSTLGRSFLPCLVEPRGQQLLALRPDRSAFLDESHPVLATIDGVEVERWLEVAASIEARGSPTFVRRRAMRNLRYLEWLRAEIALGSGRPQRDAKTVKLGLTSLDGKKRGEVDVALTSDRPIYGQRIATTTRLLDGNVGYLRIESMEDGPEFLAALDAAMASFRETRGLVIDVRGNGGGSRAALIELFPYLMAKDEGPYVSNVSAYRLDDGQKADAAEGYLGDRWLFPRSSSRWSDRDRAAIDAVASKFTPEWKPSSADFSAWHYLVLRREDNPKAFAYDKPVIVLQDSDCFSATDIFLAALAGRPRVTLIGETSGGGSGRALAYRLPNSGLTVRLSSMASFRANGQLLDGRGVEPDVRVEPAPEDFVGRGDAVLEAALSRLR